jgi:hypothetical protein
MRLHCWLLQLTAAFHVYAATVKTVELELIGLYEGVADWYHFYVDESTALGSELTHYVQLTRIDIVQQNGTFVRGANYYYFEESWFFVADIFGVIAPSPFGSDLWTVRLQEYFNTANYSGYHEQQETLGIFTGFYNPKTLQMYLDYTGQTLSMQKFGGQSFVATKVG